MNLFPTNFWGGFFPFSSAFLLQRLVFQKSLSVVLKLSCSHFFFLRSVRIQRAAKWARKLVEHDNNTFIKRGLIQALFTELWLARAHLWQIPPWRGQCRGPPWTWACCRSGRWRRCPGGLARRWFSRSCPPPQLPAVWTKTRNKVMSSLSQGEEQGKKEFWWVLM